MMTCLTMRFVKNTLGIVFATTAVSANAQEFSWKLMAVQGAGPGITCNKNSVQMLDSGNAVSLLFDDMTAELPAGDKVRKFAEGGTCMIDMKVTIPKGYYPSYTTSSLTGGVEKSRGTTGYMQFTTLFWGKYPGAPNGKNSAGLYATISHLQKVFPVLKELSQPFVDLFEQKALSKHQQAVFCDATKSSSFDARMIVYVGVGALRANSKQTVIVGVDATDSTFDLEMKPAKCPK